MNELQEKVKKFVKQNKLEMKPEFYALDMVSEMGEVAKEILKACDYGRGQHKFREELSSELGDLFYSLVTLANHYNIDLEKQVLAAIKRYEKRIGKGGTTSCALSSWV